MNELIPAGKENELIATLHLDVTELPLPFETDVFLIGTEVAGTYYAPNIEPLFKKLKVGDRVKLIREPENEYDEYAIRIDVEQDTENSSEEQDNLNLLTMPNQRKLGYIPRDRNKVLARLMDAGKLLYGKIRLKEDLGNYYKIVVKVYMKD